MSDIGKVRRALVARIVDGRGETTPAQRRAAFDNAGLDGPLAALVEKVVEHAHRVTDEDVAAVRAAGLSEDQIFELVVCAAVGQAGRQYDAASQALQAATEEE